MPRSIRCRSSPASDERQLVAFRSSMPTGYACAMSESSHESARKPAALIGWRLLALVYDLFPALALWMLASAVFTYGYTLAGHVPRENIAPLSPLQIALWLLCWGLTGLYAVWSWHRGGQTLGMRPWRLRVVAADGGRPTVAALWGRYAIGSISLLLGGAGFWWAWFDRERLTWHDRGSGTRLLRVEKTH